MVLIFKEVNSTLKEILLSRDYMMSFTNLFLTPSAKTQVFYSLPKTHKTTLKIRPIVSGKNGIFDHLGWLLQNILKPLMKKCPAHITNTKELISRFQDNQHTSLSGKIPISFDVCSLYTNIGVQEAIDTCLHHAEKFDLECYGLHLSDINTLLHLLLDNNIFTYKQQCYRQIRGLAMGSRLSGTLAILVMDRFEHTHIYGQIQPASDLYVRYVDDSNTLADNVAQAQQMLESLNTKYPTIKFELALPETDGYLPILDLKMKINEDGSLSLKHYRKKANRGLTLNYGSHHPETTKRAIALNEFQRATDYSTLDNRPSSIEQAVKKLEANGYPEKSLRPEHQLRQKRTTTTTTTKKSQFNSVLKIPYVNEIFNSHVRACLKRNGFSRTRLVNPKPETIEQISSKPKPSQVCRLRKCPIKDHFQDCTKTHVIYEARCNLCPNNYIGSTTVALRYRARQHIYAIRRCDNTYALGEHFTKDYRDTAPSVMFRVVKSCGQDELRLRIAETYWIKKLAPTLNRKTEHMGTGFLV